MKVNEVLKKDPRKHMHLVLSETLFDKITKTSQKSKITKNDFINRALEFFFEAYEKGK